MSGEKPQELPINPLLLELVGSRFLCLEAAVLSVVPQEVAHQTSLSMAFSRHKYWSRLPFPLLGDLPDPGIELASLESLPGGVFTIALPQVKSIFDRIRSFFKVHSLLSHQKISSHIIFKIF